MFVPKLRLLLTSPVQLRRRDVSMPCTHATGPLMLIVVTVIETVKWLKLGQFPDASCHSAMIPNTRLAGQRLRRACEGMAAKPLIGS